MAPKMPEDYRAARRDQILNAAAECFLEKGFHGTTMQDIFEKSGLSAGAVYNYFKSKDDIVAAISETSRVRNAALIKLVPMAVTEEAPPIAVLKTFFEMLKSPEGGRWAPLDLSLFAEASRNETIRSGIEANFHSSADALIPFVEEMQTKGECPADIDPRSLVLAFSMLVQGLQILRVVDPHADLDGYVDACLAIARCTFRGPTDREHEPEEAQR